jgi:putative SOS response-associated peptidase YedK
MCGRYHLIASNQEIIEHFKVKRLPKYQPDYNIPPGQKILTIVELDDGSYKAVNLHWGLIPSWSKDSKIASHLINARAETLAEKPSFRSAYKKRRCLIPATGFFEWHQTETGKQPYHIHYPDNHLFAFAGLWEHWENEHETLYSCTIITTTANPVMISIHQRMPVIVPTHLYNLWLTKDNQDVDVLFFDLSEAYQNIQLTPVSNRVNNPVHNDVKCLK